MIVADVNLLAYLLIDGDFTEQAEQVLRRDRRWVAPRSHRFELLNVLSTNARSGKLDTASFESLWRKAFKLVATPWEVNPLDVFRLSVESRVATYDCEYVVLARTRQLRLVTNDRQMLTVFGDVAVSISDFAAGTS